MPEQPVKGDTIRTLLVDDQTLVRSGFRLILEDQPDIEVVGEASGGRDAVRAADELQPDVVLMDIRMSEGDGLSATADITRRRPECRVLVLTTFDLDEYVYEALAAGAAGFLLKDASPERLVEAIRVVAHGDALLDPSITRMLVEEFAARRRARELPASFAELTGREQEVLRLLIRGLTNAEIGAALFLGQNTVKTHVARLLAKLGLRDRIQAVIFGYEHGLIRPATPDENPTS